MISQNPLNINKVGFSTKQYSYANVFIDFPESRVKERIRRFKMHNLKNEKNEEYKNI